MIDAVKFTPALTGPQAQLTGAASARLRTTNRRRRETGDEDRIRSAGDGTLEPGNNTKGSVKTMAVHGFVAKAMPTVVTGVVGVAAYEALAKAPWRKATVMATAWGCASSARRSARRARAPSRLD